MDDVLRKVWELDEPLVIRVRHELDPAQARLVAALGAGYVVAREAPPCARWCGHTECTVSVPVNDQVRVEPGANGELVVIAAYCGQCQQEVMPVRNGECPWCGSVIVDESQLSARAMLKQLEARANGQAADHAHHEKPANGKATWTREKAVEAIREVGENVGHTPSRAEMSAAGYGTVPQLGGRLGCSYTDLVREAGYEPNTRATGGRRSSSGREPQSGEGKTRMGPGSAQANEPSRPGKREERAASRAPASRNVTAARSEPHHVLLERQADELDAEIARLQERAALSRQIAADLRRLEELAA